MEIQKIFLAENLKFLRERKKLTQEVIAASLGMTRVKWNALESGKTMNPAILDIVGISRYFKIATDSLLTTELSKLGDVKLNELEAGSDIYLAGKNIRILSITVNSENKENMEYVPIKAKAGYRDGFSDPEYLATLPKFSLPNLPRNGTFRMFPIEGDSMLPIPSGSDVVAKYVQDWKSVKPGTLCIVVLNGAGDFVFKQVTLLNGGHVLLQSLNPLYESYTVEVSDVLEIWQYHSYISQAIPEEPTDLATIMVELRRLQKQVASINN